MADLGAIDIMASVEVKTLQNISAPRTLQLLIYEIHALRELITEQVRELFLASQSAHTYALKDDHT